ncbi:MAG TPA: 30S ribosomal protein S5 [Fimbriimonadaceae bacterium]|nr:30S ribosomal protein S5 [Fimbriimonadaceae bacterium]
MARGPRLIGRRQSSRRDQEGPQYDVRIINSNKVFKTTKGGKTASWSILVVVGDNKGMVGIGHGKARGIPDAITKAEDTARKNMFKVELLGDTIPHEVRSTSGAATVVLKPASPGTGVKAGSALRHCLEAAGVHNVLAKCLGSRNPTNIAHATLKAFKSLRAPEQIAARRGADVKELVPWLAKARKEEADSA